MRMFIFTRDINNLHMRMMRNDEEGIGWMSADGILCFHHKAITNLVFHYSTHARTHARMDGILQQLLQLLLLEEPNGSTRTPPRSLRRIPCDRSFPRVPHSINHSRSGGARPRATMPQLGRAQRRGHALPSPADADAADRIRPSRACALSEPNPRLD